MLVVGHDLIGQCHLCLSPVGGSLFKSALHITLCLFYMSLLDFVSLLPVPVCVLVSCSLINLVNLSFRHREGGVREQVLLRN